MFVGREKELRLIQEFLEKPGAMALYGKRRVGKTALVKQAFALAKKPFFYYQCVKDTYQNNVAMLVAELVRNNIVPEMFSADSLSSVFYFLSLQKKHFDIVIDEYTYLFKYTAREIVDSDLQKAIDNYSSDINLILTGSELTAMNGLLEQGNPLFGRLRLRMHLSELTYREAALFYPDKTPYEKVGFYAVFGGSPYVNGFLDPDLDLESNIKKLFLNTSSSVFDYASELLFTSVSDSYSVQQILSILRNGKKRVNEIENALGATKNGLINKKLKALIGMEIIDKVCPINREGDDKKTRYEIADNCVRFFHTFLYPNLSALSSSSQDAFYSAFLESGGRLREYISHCFERIARDYFRLLSLEGKRNDILRVGTYYYDDASRKRNGEFDVAMQKTNGKYAIAEVKYYAPDHLFSILEMEKESQQIKGIPDLQVDEILFVATYAETTPAHHVILAEDFY